MKLSQPKIDMLNQPVPAWAVKPHPTRNGMSTIHPMAIIDRLNEVFGVAGWSYLVEYISCDKEVQKTQKGQRDVYVSAVKGTLKIDDLTIEQFGGSTNDDRGDALKGGGTDALTKIASYLGVAAAIYKNQGNHENKIDEAVEPSTKPYAVAAKPANEPEPLISEKQLTYLSMLMIEKGILEKDVYNDYCITSRKELTKKQASELIDNLVKIPTVVPSFKTSQKASALDVARIRLLLTEMKKDEERLLMHYSVGHIEDLNPQQAYEVILELNRQKGTKNYGDDPVMSSIDNL